MTVIVVLVLRSLCCETREEREFGRKESKNGVKKESTNVACVHQIAAAPAITRRREINQGTGVHGGEAGIKEVNIAHAPRFWIAYQRSYRPPRRLSSQPANIADRKSIMKNKARPLLSTHTPTVSPAVPMHCNTKQTAAPFTCSSLCAGVCGAL